MTPLPPPPKVTHQIGIRVLDPPRVPQGRSKIIMLKLGERIGDFLVAISAFRLLRKNFDQAEMTLVCTPSLVSIAEATGLFDRVVGFAYVADVMNQGGVPDVTTEEKHAAFRAILDGPYFLAVDLRYDGSTRPWLDHIDAHCRAGFGDLTGKGLDILLPPTEWEVPSAAVARGVNLPIHAEVRLTALAETIVSSLIEKTIDRDVFPHDDAIKALPTYRQLVDEPRLKIGLSVGAGSELRQWKGDYWRQLIAKLLPRDPLLVIFGGPEDRALTDVLVAGLPEGSYLDLTGALALETVPAHLALCNAYIGCDTGLTHLAGNLGLPTVNMFAGISNISVWRVRGPRVKSVYAELICAPCHLRFKEDCPNNNVCMGALVPDIVFACFEQVIAP